MADSYTVFWTMDRWLSAVAVGHRPLPVLFGGPHLSEPSFIRAGVRVGDLIYPVAVANRRVHVVARMRIREMILLGQEDGPSLIEQRFPQFRDWRFLAPTSNLQSRNCGKRCSMRQRFPQFRDWRFLAPTCTDEVLIGMDGTAPRADLPVPAETLTKLTFRSQRGERHLKHVKDGELTSSISLQGIYRLTPASADDLAELIESLPATAGPRIPRPARGAERRGVPASEDALF